jgi:hypothetical protein
MHRGRFKTPTALGETLGKIFSDRGSIPLISTNSVTIAYAVVTFSVYVKMHPQTFDKKKALTFYSQSLILPWQCLGFIKFYHTAL